MCAVRMRRSRLIALPAWAESNPKSAKPTSSLPTHHKAALIVPDGPSEATVMAKQGGADLTPAHPHAPDPGHPGIHPALSSPSEAYSTLPSASGTTH